MERIDATATISASPTNHHHNHHLHQWNNQGSVLGGTSTFSDKKSPTCIKRSSRSSSKIHVLSSMMLPTFSISERFWAKSRTGSSQNRRTRPPVSSVATQIILVYISSTVKLFPQGFMFLQFFIVIFETSFCVSWKWRGSERRTASNSLPF